jgi:DNA polymerase III delta subunit
MLYYRRATMPDREVTPMKTQFNLFEWRLKLESETREVWSWSKIAKEAGVHPNTISGIATNSATRIDLETVAKIVNLLRRKGIDVRSGDLLVDVPLVDAA